MTGEVYTYGSSTTQYQGGASVPEDSNEASATYQTSNAPEGSYVDAKNRVLDAIIMAMTEARKSFRAQQLLLSESSYLLLMQSADKKDSAANKAMVAGIVGGAATMLGGGVNLGYTAKAGRMLRADARPPANAAPGYDMRTGSQLSLERGRGIGQMSESSGGVASSSATYMSKQDEADADRYQAASDRARGYSDAAGGYLSLIHI